MLALQPHAKRIRNRIRTRARKPTPTKLYNLSHPERSLLLMSAHPARLREAGLADEIPAEPDWDMAAQSAPDYGVDQRLNW